jgi:hypothetical protein
MSDHAREVRLALADPVKLCGALGYSEGAKRQARGLLIRCPFHGERDPSCSVTIAEDQTIRVKCFACDKRTDALGLIAHQLGRSTDGSDFFEVLAEGARIAGLLELEAEIRDGRPRPDRPRAEAPPPRPEVPYPDQGEILEVWRRGLLPGDDAETSRYLVGRKIDPVAIGERGLARVLMPPAPSWAIFGSRSWIETGHRLIVRVFDSHGQPRSVRGVRVRDNDTPKRLPPTQKKAKGLCMVNRSACAMLRNQEHPGRIVVVEGEPDFLTWGTLTEEPVIGLVIGAWSEEFAAAVPRACRVVIRTHEDDAGERYANEVIETLKSRQCTFRRVSSEAA